MKIHVTDHQGKSHALPAEPGLKVMEIIREAGLPIAAQCGGCCSCSTCHVYVGEAWLSRLPASTADEEGVLDLAPELQAGSRLSCQIIMAPQLDGLEVTLAPGSEP